eukprot:CAMPEP_0194488384 /NCGR_PEP_ID=MMETSP0253-20130528/8326_1 /TAXON_ID=2966 /ORGANISM="Noctiluca scintillans" /LENGTH=124 /DNA_ID=CAMNT_0039328737 /DNA_START=202 /DNA_END=577 /DNA_ORIENTATION=-
MNSVVVKGERLPCMLTQFLAGASLDIVAHAGGGEGLDAGRLRPGGFTSLLLLGHGWTEKSGNSCAMKARVLVLTWAGAASSELDSSIPWWAAEFTLIPFGEAPERAATMDARAHERETYDGKNG